MTEDWERKYFERRAAQQQGQQPQGPRNPSDLPHFEPAHITQNRQRAAQQGGQHNMGWQDIDVTSAMYSNADGLASRNMGPQAQAQQQVMLREGAIYYRAIQADGFGTTMPMVRNCGPVVGVVGKEFELRGETSCYLIDNMDVVDLANINPQKMLSLVEIRAPFLGTLLVEKNSIITPRPPNAGRQVLND